jgi:hypothetical protein
MTKELKLVSTCYFRADGVMCHDGELYYPETGRPMMVEGEIMECPACNGKAVILTEYGKQLMAFLEVFARPALREIVREVLEQEHS